MAMTILMPGIDRSFLKAVLFVTSLQFTKTNKDDETYSQASKGRLECFHYKSRYFYLHWTFLFLLGWLVLVNAESGNNLDELFWSVAFLSLCWPR
ncbi:MAG: hypothetical protein EOP04_32270 [Proteobacteria bacterium]|nr:MAG: hypothetical protein EOP04_32270 [Pseudomonadota bacterium]